MDAAEAGFSGAVKLSGCKAVEDVHFGRPFDLVGLDVPVEGADAGDFLGEAKFALALPEELGFALTFVKIVDLGDIFDLMDDVNDVALGVEDGGVDGLPIADFEGALGLGCLDVVTLDGHGVGGAACQDALEGGAEVSYAVGGWIAGVVGEDVEKFAADDGLALRGGGSEVGIRDCNNCEVRG